MHCLLVLNGVLDKEECRNQKNYSFFATFLPNHLIDIFIKLLAVYYEDNIEISLTIDVLKVLINEIFFGYYRKSTATFRMW